ncbi:MAG: MarR family transcriptional regulator [Clostridia bacterium]|nr:MarR family transcriptional regulator [Clostridia bacterium]
MERASHEAAPQLCLENQLCFPLYACSRRIVSLYTPYFRPLGLTYTQYVVFMALWEEDGLTVGELGKRLYLDNGTLTPLLKKMEANGWIDRRRSREDERVVTVHLTQEGWKMRASAAHIPSSVASSLSLSREEAAQLHTLLHRLLSQMCDRQGGS